MNRRWVVLAIAGVMTVITFVGFSVQAFDWIDIALVGALTILEIKSFTRPRQLLRLVIVIPFAIMIILASPLTRFLSPEGLLILKWFGVVTIALYFWYKYKVRNQR